MILEKEFWDYRIHANVEKIELFFEERDMTLGEELLNSRDPFIFGVIADYVTNQYRFTNRFKWSNYTRAFFDLLHKQAISFLESQTTTLDKNVYISALRFLATFSEKGDASIIYQFKKLNSINESSFLELLNETLVNTYTYAGNIPIQELSSFLLEEIRKDIFPSFYCKLIGLLGYLDKEVCDWVREKFEDLEYSYQENVFDWTFSVGQDHEYSKLLFSKIPEVLPSNNIGLRLVYDIHTTKDKYIKELLQDPWYVASDKLEKCLYAHQYYKKEQQYPLFGEILLNENLALRARLEFCSNLIKFSKKDRSFYLGAKSFMMKFFIELKQKDHAIPDQMRVDMFLEEEEEKLKALNTTKDLWYQKWI
ncbi:MAG: hypothetical protein MK212_12945 [Saprospiraceae bacterium]|nr:hypothetical protein [Saprospiraceae bacterium]